MIKEYVKKFDGFINERLNENKELAPKSFKDIKIGDTIIFYPPGDFDGELETAEVTGYNSNRTEDFYVVFRSETPGVEYNIPLEYVYRYIKK